MQIKNFYILDSSFSLKKIDCDEFTDKDCNRYEIWMNKMKKARVSTIHCEIRVLTHACELAKAIFLCSVCGYIFNDISLLTLSYRD